MIKRIQTHTHDEWLELRHKYIGGSDAAAVVGLNSFTSPYSLWAEKTGKVPGFKGNLATETGTFLEPFVASKFAEITGKKIRNNNYSMVNDKYPFAIANIDRQILGEKAGLEIKTTSDLNLKKFKNGEYPSNYYCQCVHYMAVTGWDRWYLACLIGNHDLKIFEIERDEDEIKALMDAERTFFGYIQRDEAPPVDGADATSGAIARMYPFSSDDDSSCDLIGFDKVLDEYEEIDAQIKALEKLKDEKANELKTYMQDISIGKSEKYKVSWKTQERRTFDSKAFMADHEDEDLTKYWKLSISRPFKVTEIKKED